MYRLSEAEQTLIHELAGIADESIAPNAAAVDAEGRFPQEAIDALANTGFLGLTVPTEYGGRGHGLRAAGAALETIASRCASTAMIYLMHVCGCAGYMLRPRAGADALGKVGRGEHLATLAFSEKGSRSHFWAPVSKAVRRGGTAVLNAEKSFVTAAGHANGYVVSTLDADGDSPTASTLYIVYADDPGVHVSGPWNSLGLRGNASSPMTFVDCTIPEDRAVCEPGAGFDAMMQILPWFNLGSAAISVGLCESATSATIKHISGTRLEHLGSSLSDLPTLRARVARMRIETDAARAHLLSSYDAVESGSEAATLMVLEAKSFAAETAISVTDAAMRACGGAAFGRQLSVERNFRDARAASVMAPTTDVLLELIGRALCGMPLF